GGIGARLSPMHRVFGASARWAALSRWLKHGEAPHTAPGATAPTAPHAPAARRRARLRSLIQHHLANRLAVPLSAGRRGRLSHNRPRRGETGNRTHHQSHDTLLGQPLPKPRTTDRFYNSSGRANAAGL